MNKRTLFMASAIVMAAAAIIAVGLFSDDSDATSFGSDNLGAESITFNANGGTGGYTIHSFSGNTIYFPTEYKTPGASNSDYVKISKTGYVLMGWSTSAAVNSSPSYYPGQAWQVQSNGNHSTTFYAVWKQMESGQIDGNDNDDDITSEHYTVPSGTPLSLDVNGGDNADCVRLFENISSQSIQVSHSYDRTITVTYNGSSVSGSVGLGEQTKVNNGNVFVGMENGSFVITGSPYTGVYQIRVHAYEHVKYKTMEYEFEYDAYWYLSVYDVSTDPSQIYHVTYSETSQSTRYDFTNNCGPYGTAIQLPDAIYNAQADWNAERMGQTAYIPLGGKYVVTQDYNITPHRISYQQAIQVIAIVAYNANGGDYQGQIAQTPERGTYYSLSSGSIVTKTGYSFLGWNLTGNENDPIYPGGYLYHIPQGDSGELYIEFKAVWSASSNNATVELRCPSNGELNTSFSASTGHRYHLPESGFDVGGYDFLGWSTISYPKGDGSVNVTSPVTVTGNQTYYAVYKKTVYSGTVEYSANGGLGSMSPKTVTSETLPFTVELDAVRFVRDGYRFLGWSENPHSDSPTVSNTYTFTGSGTITLYAIWTESTVTNDNLFVVIYNGNGQDVSNIITPVFSKTTSEREITVTVPSWEPVRQNYSFMGWSTSSNGSVQYRHGSVDSFTMSLTGTDTYMEITLYAVWEAMGHTEPQGEKVIVTFMVDTTVVRTERVDKGTPVPYYSPSSVEFKAFDGWYSDEGRWDFSNPVNDDTVLNAKYIRIFSISVDGNSVRIVIDGDISPAWTKVAFSDGFTETYYTPAIPAHDATSNGTVTVQVGIEQGTYTAKGSFSITEIDTNEEDGGQDQKGAEPESDFFANNQIYIIAGVVGIIAIIILAGRFLI